MKLECLLETTEDLRSHTYLIDKDAGKMLAYRKDTGELQVFSKPLSFGKKYRKFKKVVDKELLDAILEA